VDALREVLPLEALLAARATAHDDLGVDHALLRKETAHVLDDLREVRRQRLAAATRQLHLVAVPQDEAAEAVPLRFVDEASGHAVGGGHLLDGLGKHGLDGQVDGLLHAGHCLLSRA
jgi:hypothetical protein